MSINFSIKTQNLRSLNLSNSSTSYKEKIKASCHEKNSILLLTNCQIGNKEHLIKKEFLTTQNGPYHIFTNSKSNTSAGVLIALHNDLDAKVIDHRADNDNRLLILKLQINLDIFGIGVIYDYNNNTTHLLEQAKKLFNELNCNQARILGGDMNVITDVILDQRGYTGVHARRKAAEMHETWDKSGYLRDAYRALHKERKGTDHHLEKVEG